MMVGLLLARSGIDVTVLEKHADFFRDFRGDTIHPSTMEVLDELGMLDDLLKLPHQEIRQLAGQVGDTKLNLADFTHLPVRRKFLVIMPQWDFLNFLSEKARAYPGFHAEMETPVTGLTFSGEQVTGVRCGGPNGERTIAADLVIGADGRDSTVRQAAGLKPEDFGAPMDVLWMRISRDPHDPSQLLGRIDYGQMQQIAREQKPKMIIAGASAYARIIDFEPFAEVAREIGAKFVVDMAHFAGLVATGYHPSPIPHADAVTSTTHKTLRGPRGGLILCKEEHARTVDKAMFPGTQGGPLEHIVAAKAVAFKEALEPSFKDYCGQIVRNAQALANALIELGFNLVSGGTDNHLMLVDLRNKNVTGKVAEKALDAAGITVNKNTVPKETQSPFVTSGIRIGTPALTTRGMREPEMELIARLIDRVITSGGDAGVASSVKEEVLDLTNRFPLYKSFPSMAETK